MFCLWNALILARIDVEIMIQEGKKRVENGGFYLTRGVGRWLDISKRIEGCYSTIWRHVALWGMHRSSAHIIYILIY